jgi:hypothetical protein
MSLVDALRRFWRGGLRRREWILHVPKTRPRPMVEDLLAGLERRGYAFAELHRDVAVVDAPIRLVDARLERDPQAGVTLRIVDETGLGTIESVDGRRSGYEELVLYVLAELGALFPGTTYQESDSSLSPDDAADLPGLLPERPEALSSQG